MASQKKSLYEILGVGRDANAIDIGLAHERRKAELQRASPQDQNALALVHQAHEILSNPKRRAAYDASLVTAAEKAAAAEQSQSPDLVLEGGDEDEKKPPKHLVPIIAGLGVIVIALAIILRPGHDDAPKPAPAPVVEAPKPAPPPPPPKPLFANQILPAAMLSVGRVMSYDMTGAAKPISLALAVESDKMLTTCHGIPAGSKLVVKVDKELLSADLAETDEEIDLCRLPVPGLNLRPLKIATEEAKAGDKVFALGVNDKGDYALTEGTVKQTRIAGGTKLLELSIPINPNSSGGAVLNVYGQLVGIATTPHRYGVGQNLAISSAWISQIRSRARAVQ